MIAGNEGYVILSEVRQLTGAAKNLHLGFEGQSTADPSLRSG